MNPGVNDVDNIVSFITDKCGFSYSNVKILTDNTLKTPSKANILEELEPGSKEYKYFVKIYKKMAKRNDQRNSE